MQRSTWNNFSCALRFSRKHTHGRTTPTYRRRSRNRTGTDFTPWETLSQRLLSYRDFLFFPYGMTLRTKEQPSDSTHIGTFSHQGEYVLISIQTIPPNAITVVSILLPKDQRRSDPLLASFLDNLSIPQTRPNIDGDFVFHCHYGVSQEWECSVVQVGARYMGVAAWDAWNLIQGHRI